MVRFFCFVLFLRITFWKQSREISTTTASKANTKFLSLSWYWKITLHQRAIWISGSFWHRELKKGGCDSQTPHPARKWGTLTVASAICWTVHSGNVVSAGFWVFPLNMRICSLWPKSESPVSLDSVSIVLQGKLTFELPTQQLSLYGFPSASQW